MFTIEKDISLVEEILSPWQRTLGDCYSGYKNHVYRVVHYNFALVFFSAEKMTPDIRSKIIIASCFHDLGTWIPRDSDALPPSIALACEYLENRNLEHWGAEIALMIHKHHQFRSHSEPHFPLVERFRQSSLIDASLGILQFGLPKLTVQRIQKNFPNQGFRRQWTHFAGDWFAQHPLRFPPFLR